MGPQRLKVAKLNEKQMKTLKNLEKELGGLCVVALEKKFEVADLTDAQLKKLQAAEKELGGVILVAYKGE